MKRLVLACRLAAAAGTDSPGLFDDPRLIGGVNARRDGALDRRQDGGTAAAVLLQITGVSSQGLG